MALIFGLRGDSLDARCATHDAAHGIYSTNASFDPSLEASGWTGELFSSSIKLRNGTTSCTSSLVFLGRNNTPAKGFSANIRCGFATTSGLLALWGFSGGQKAVAYNAGVYYNAGTLNFRWNDFAGNVRVNVNSAWTPTINTMYDIFVTWDGTTAANAAKLYVDASSLATATAGLARPTDDRKQITTLAIGTAAWDIQSTCIDVNEFTLWDSTVDPTAVTLDSGSGSLNGASRVSPITCAAFDGATYTDPGVANVKTGTSYTYAGSSQSGTYAPPAGGKGQLGSRNIG